MNNSWQDAFPSEDIKLIVEFIQDTWHRLIDINTEGVKPDNLEPNITQTLNSALQSIKIENGLTGDFSAEGCVDYFDWDKARRTNSGRTDIKYFSDRTNIEITFEFKKLNTSNLSSYYGDSGMGRFVSGKYSREKNIGFMVGLITKKSHSKKIINALIKKLSTSDMKTKLNLIKSQDGDLIRIPSKTLPGIVSFDTEHDRVQIKKSPNIIVCHFYLCHD